MKSNLVFTIVFITVLLNSSCCNSRKDMSNENFVVINSDKEEVTNIFRETTLCEILDDATRFDHKEIEVTAILITGREYTYLYDPNCRGTKEKELWYEIMDEAANKKLDSIVNPDTMEYREVGLIRAKADFTGILIVNKGKGFGPNGHFLYKLQIRGIKNISPVASEIPYPWQTKSDIK